MKERNKFIICKYLDEQIRVAGLLPLDEFIPAIVVFLFSFILGHLLIGMVLMVIVIKMLKQLKQGKGSEIIVTSLYWHISCSDWILQSFPKSTKRYWV